MRTKRNLKYFLKNFLYLSLMQLVQEKSNQIEVSQVFVIAASSNKQYKFNVNQKIGIAALTLVILACCIIMYTVSNSTSAFGLMVFYLALLGIAFRQITKNKQYFRAYFDNGMLHFDFETDGLNNQPERHRISVPSNGITAYNTQSFLGGKISHLSIQFHENDKSVVTRPILVEALSKDELKKLLTYLDAQISKVNRLANHI